MLSQVMTRFNTSIKITSVIPVYNVPIICDNSEDDEFSITEKFFVVSLKGRCFIANISVQFFDGKYQLYSNADNEIQRKSSPDSAVISVSWWITILFIVFSMICFIIIIGLVCKLCASPGRLEMANEQREENIYDEPWSWLPPHLRIQRDRGPVCNRVTN